MLRGRRTWFPLVSIVLALVADPALAVNCAQYVERSGVVHFPSQEAIERFDLAAGAWAAAIPAPHWTPAPLAVDANSFYVPEQISRDYLRIDESGAELARYSTPSAVYDLEVDGDLVLVAGSRSLHSFQRDSGALLSEIELPYTVEGITLLPNRRILVSYSGTTMLVDYDDVGALSNARELDPDGDLPPIRDPRLFPDGSHLIDRHGAIWDTAGPTYMDTLSEAGSQVAFLEDGWIVQGNRSIRMVDSDLETLGWQDGFGPIRDVFTHAGSAWLLECQYSFATFHPLDLEQFGPRPLDPPLSPDMASRWAPDTVVVGEDGIVYVHPVSTRSHFRPSLRQLFRWSLEERRYLTSIPLSYTPHLLTSEPGEGVLLGVSGRIVRIPPGASGGFTRLFGQPIHTDCGPIPVAGGYYLCRDDRRLLFDASGAPASSGSAVNRAADVVWDAARSRIVEHRIPSYSPERHVLVSIEITPEGELVEGSEVEAPTADSPLRVSGDGDWILAGRHIFDGSTFERVRELGDEVVDAAFSGATLLSVVRTAYDGAFYREEAAAGGVLRRFSAPGIPLRIVPHAGDAIYGYRDGGVTRFLRFTPGSDDLDGDSFRNVDDEFPLDRGEWLDTDGDGTGDNSDDFPDDPLWDTDSDADGLDDRVDLLPRLPVPRIGRAYGRHTMKASGRKRFRLGFDDWQIHLRDEENFILCFELETCVTGTYERKGGGGQAFSLSLTLESIGILGRQLGAEWAGRLDVPLDLPLVPGSVKIRLKPKADGAEFRLRMKARYRGETVEAGRIRGRYTLKGSGGWHAGASLR